AENDRSACWHRRTRRLPPRGRQRSWLLRRRREVEFGVVGESLGLLGAALPAAEAVGFPDPVGCRLNGDPYFCVLAERHRLGRLEHAVCVDGFDGQGHGGPSGATVMRPFYPPRRPPPPTFSAIRELRREPPRPIRTHPAAPAPG